MYLLHDMKKILSVSIFIILVFGMAIHSCDNFQLPGSADGEEDISDSPDDNSEPANDNPDSEAVINITAPDSIEQLIFVHHSCGNNWLGTGNGNLGDSLAANNYYVRDTYYGWDAVLNTDIGSSTDTDDWLTWFCDSTVQSNGETRSGNIMSSLYETDNQNASYTVLSNPGGENDIIMFKSCYPCSEVGLSIDDEKAIYIQLLDYFVLHQDKLFILVTPPGETVVSSYLLTRELCEWLVDEENGWLKDYTGNNVGVFDFYCVLSEENSHHTIENGSIIYEYASDYDGTSPYHDYDNHPNSDGNQKSTDEFIPLLNYYRNRWRGVE